MSFLYNNSTICEPTQVSEKFNEYFVSVGSSLANKIPYNHRKVQDYLKGNYIDSMLLSPVDCQEVSSAILNGTKLLEMMTSMLTLLKHVLEFFVSQ